jgi:hypothetical protein
MHVLPANGDGELAWQMRDSCGWIPKEPSGWRAQGCRKFFDELNDMGWDLQLQAQKVEREAQKGEIKS